MNPSNDTVESYLIAVVDDSPLERMMTMEALRQARFKVEEFADGAAITEAYFDIRPDLVVLDVNMPRMDGFTACSKIRSTADGAHVPILMMTGLDDVNSINRAYEVGATDFITKPLNATILVHRVRYMMRAQQTARELRESESLLRHAQQRAKLGSWQWHLASQYMSRSEQAVQTIGAERRGQRESLAQLLQRVHVDDRERVEATYQRVLANAESQSIDYRLAFAGGACIVQEEIDADVDSQGNVVRLIGTIQDISERRRTEERIRLLAYYDGVTGLPNRMLLGEHIKKTLDCSKRFDRVAALLFLDLDHFKRINDTLGHNTGDDLLRLVAERLCDCIRGCDVVAAVRTEPDAKVGDSSFSAVARLGGDEFVILLSEVGQAENAALVAARVIDCLKKPFRLASNDLYVTVSIGISTSEESKNTDVLLKHADAAMYHAKDEGRNCYKFYTQELNERALRRMKLEARLLTATKNGEFVLFYQPKIDIRTGRVTGAEALIRWMHPETGLVPPETFIPIAEETGLIASIGDWVLSEACGRCASWHDRGLPPIGVSVNISAHQCRDEKLYETVAAALESSGLDPGCLELEVTESLLMHDIESSALLLNRLKSLGVKISIDDFGTGYSSLKYLKSLPLDTIKIDRSFIHDIATDPDDASIVEATINLGHDLRLNVVAEGVESWRELVFLREHNCDEIQGFLYSKPLASVDFEEWLDRHRGGCDVGWKDLTAVG